MAALSRSAAATALMTAPMLNVNGATFAIGAFSETVATVTLTSGSITGTTGVLTSTNTIQTESGTISAILAGTNGLTQSTAGTTTLSGFNTYTGTTLINGGNAVGRRGDHRCRRRSPPPAPWLAAARSAPSPTRAWSAPATRPES